MRRIPKKNWLLLLACILFTFLVLRDQFFIVGFVRGAPAIFLVALAMIFFPLKLIFFGAHYIHRRIKTVKEKES